MSLKKLLEERKISVNQCSKLSGIPYTTLLEVVNGKTKIEKCTAETVYKLAEVLGVSMEEVMRIGESETKQISFETFKGNVCHLLKEKGDMDFLIEVLQKDEVSSYWRMRRYAEALYMLGMVDYLSRENDIPLYRQYDNMRQYSLEEPLYPRDVELIAKLEGNDEIKQTAEKNAIPEFRRFNIMEGDVRNVC